MKQGNEKSKRRINGFRAVHRGQSLIVAVITMFVMLFIGGIFVALVAHNLQSAGRSRQDTMARQLAEAGVRYASYMLLNSPQGADWRPALQDMTTVIPNDPDIIYLNSTDPEGRYARVNFGEGRALIRVSYFVDPGNARYIKIESIGRVGIYNPNDPTTFTATPPRLRRKMVAYMAIGLTDYLRYVTNYNNDSKAEADIGTPPVGVPFPNVMGGMQVRMPGNTGFTQTYAPIYANCNLRLLGNVALSEAVASNGGIKSSGNILLDNNGPATMNGNQVIPSGANFNTFGGLIRDGSSTPDSNGYNNGITRLPPPSLNAVDPATNQNRYYSLTRDSGQVLPNSSTLSGSYILGNGLYVNDANDTEQTTAYIAGGQSLRSIWLNPSKNTPGWNGPYYTPPGLQVEIGYFGNPAVPGIQLVRDDSTFPDLPGNNDTTNPPLQREAVFSFFYYRPADNSSPVLKLDNPFYRAWLKNVTGKDDNFVDNWLPAFNGVILAEGNIRIKGLIPAKANIPVRGPGNGNMNLALPPALSIVSNSNIYIEGSIVREDPASCVALMAQDYVTVNTTQFLAPVGSNLAFVSSSGDTNPPYHVDVPIGQRYTVDFTFGDDASKYTTGSNPSPVMLLLRQGSPEPISPPGATYVNLFVNQWMGGNPLYMFAPNTPTYTLQNSQQYDLFEHRSFPLEPVPNGSAYTLNSAPGIHNVLSIGPDPTAAGTPPPQDYLFSRVAVVPMDVRIEALIYAQTGSFFIIPGYPLNADPNDTNPSTRPAGTDPAYPLYYQPIDCRITVVGAVSENLTASPADQAAWMQLWGYIPRVYGSSNITVPDQHLKGEDIGASDGTDAGLPNVQGLRFLYDPMLQDPQYPGNGPFLRVDPQNRPLPPLPCLPVCPGFVYYGEES
jgi:hypothetical protein